MKDPRLRNWSKRNHDWKHYCGFFRVLESLIPVLIAIATLLLFLLLIINPGTLLALALFLLVLVLFSFIRKC